MEWVEGTPLEDWTRGRCPADHLLREAEQLLAVLAQQRLVHADMGHDFWSPMGRECNLRITAEQRLVAIDFAGSLRRSPWPLWGGLADCLQQHDQLLLTKILYHFGDASTQDHPAWRYPSQLPPHWWELMRCLGKV